MNKSQEKNDRKYSKDRTSPAHSAEDKPKTRAGTGSMKTFQKYELMIENDQIVEQLKCIKWRSQTEFPISKILFYKVLDKKRLNQCTVVQIAIENYLTTLHLMPSIPLFNVLYIAKEALIGFQRLYDQFGSFDINSKMIFINKIGKCKVWCHENICKNHPSQLVALSQRLFKNQIVQLLEQKCLKSALTQEFFKILKEKSTLIEAINSIKEFCQKKRIIASNNITSIHHSLQRKNSSPGKLSCNKSVQGSTKKVPKFIAKICEDKKHSSNGSHVSSQLSKVSSQSGLSIRNCKRTLTSNKSLRTFSKLNEEVEAIDMQQKNQPQNRKRERTFCTNNSSTPTTEMNIKTPKTDIVELHKQESGFRTQEKQKSSLFINKNPFKSQIDKYRKASHQDVPLRGKHVYQQKPQSNQNEQTITININTVERKQQMKRPPKRVTENNIRQTIESSPHIQVLMRYAQKKQEPEDDKKCWLKRIDSLNTKNFRQTVYSSSDGEDQMAEHMLMNSIKLELLDQLGKQLKGSILMNNQ